MTSTTTDTDFSDSQYLDMDLLRFTTAGSVDDGKSTLIGRLLYDSKSIFEDQWETLERSSAQRGDDRVNLALLNDRSASSSSPTRRATCNIRAIW
jgi:translation elongation factor EF-1alpha